MRPLHRGGAARWLFAPVEVAAEDEEANYKTIDAREALDDVDSVEHNMLVAS